MQQTKPLILIVDDNPDDCELIRRALPKDVFDVLCASTFEEAVAILLTKNVYLAVVDIYLDEDDRKARGNLLYDKFRSLVPLILMSGRVLNPNEHMLGRFKDERFLFIKKSDVEDHPNDVLLQIRRHADKTYNHDIAIEFDSSTSWMGLADKLGDASDPALDPFHIAHELQWLVRKLFCDWDQSDSDHVRATSLVLKTIQNTTNRSAVLEVHPRTKTRDDQADVILKIKRISKPGAKTLSAPLTMPDASDADDRDPQDEHPQFVQFKNVIGGYGLHEQRYASTCHFVGQVFSVPYFRYDETRTYADFYKAVPETADGLTQIEDVTRYVFANCLAHFDRRAKTGESLLLSDYYDGRIGLSRRLGAIRYDLDTQTRPLGIRDEDGLWVLPMLNGQIMRVTDPTEPVLSQRSYPSRDERVPTQLRHGDMHAGNIIVDTTLRCCWFIDYESFGLDHYNLVDHVELEASILFSLTRLDGHLQAWTSLIDALSRPSLTDIGLETSLAAPSARVTLDKALAAIRVIRTAADSVSGANPPRPYYHGLMYEAFRVAGKASADPRHRWHALIAAAILFDKLTKDT